MTVACSSCGREFDQDPAREVPCPSCGADIGSPCRRPSDWTCAIHHPRDRLAIIATSYGPCPESDGEGEAEAAYRLLESDVGLANALDELDLLREDIETLAGLFDESSEQREPEETSLDAFVDGRSA